VFVLARHHYSIPKFKRIDLKRLVVMCPEGHTTVCFVSLYSYCVVNPLLNSDFHHHFVAGPAWLGERLCRPFPLRQAPTFLRRSAPFSARLFRLSQLIQPARLRWGGHHGALAQLSTSGLESVKIHQRIGVFRKQRPHPLHLFYRITA
jgi:hypothetical protein